MTGDAAYAEAYQEQWNLMGFPTTVEVFQTNTEGSFIKLRLSENEESRPAVMKPLGTTFIKCFWYTYNDMLPTHPRMATITIAKAYSMLSSYCFP